MRPKTQQVRGRLVPQRAAQSGIVLPFALFVTVLILILGVAFLQTSATESLTFTRNVQRLQANAAAEYGIACAQAMCMSTGNMHGLWYTMTYNGTPLTTSPGWTTSAGNSIYGGYEICNLFTNQTVPANSAATYSVVIQELSDLGILCSNYRIHSFGTVGNYTRHVSVDCQALNFGSFAWLTNSETDSAGSKVYWATNEAIGGWNNSALIWSNGQFNIDGSPAFYGPVYSGASSLNEMNGSNPSFLTNYPVFSAPDLPLSSVMSNNDITAIKNGVANGGGVSVAANTNDPTPLPTNDPSNPSNKSTYGYNLVFNGSSYTIYTLTKTGNRILSPAPQTGTIPSAGMAFYFNDQVLVSGTITGQVTIGTSAGNDIQIVGNLEYSYPAPSSYSTTLFSSSYSYDPLTDTNFTSNCALISGGDIVVEPTTWNATTGAVSAPAWSDVGSDMYITAVMAAIGNGSSTTPGQFWNYFWKSGTPQATLNVFGGICQEERGPVGQVGTTGFIKNYVFDPRNSTQPPPFLQNMTIGAMFSNWQLY
jgi:hypothetical protein